MLSERSYTPDANLIFADNAGPYVQSGYCQANGAQAVFDLGGNQGVTPQQMARIEAVAVLTVPAIKTTAGNETYKILVLVSNDLAFGAGNVVVAGGIELGAAGALDAPNTGASVAGDYEIGFTNQVAGSMYQYLAFFVAIGGTAPSINLEGFVAELMRTP